MCTLRVIIAFCYLLPLISLGRPAAAGQTQYFTVAGLGGVPLAVAEAGNSQGSPILFIHGYSQSLLSWKYQLGDPGLQARYRLVALDLRGHGASGKPWQPEAYDRAAIGGDIQAVIEARGLRRPVLVGWSYGGEVVMAYLRHHGSRDTRGLVFVDTSTSLEGPARPPDPSVPQTARLMEAVQKMWSADVVANLQGTKAFIASLTARPLSQADSDEALMYNMLTPAYARVAMRYIPDNSDLIGRLDVPTLIIHGAKDVISPVAESVTSQKLIPGSTLLVYENAGHAPFLEEAERFNRDLAGFIERVSK